MMFQKTDYEKLIIEITTNGSILPKDALKEAAKILIYHFMLFSDEKITLETTETDSNEEFDEEVLRMRQLLKLALASVVKMRLCMMRETVMLASKASRNRKPSW